MPQSLSKVLWGKFVTFRVCARLWQSNWCIIDRNTSNRWLWSLISDHTHYNQLQDTPQFSDVTGKGTVSHHYHCSWIIRHPCLADHMAQEHCLSPEQLTFLWVQTQASSVNGLEDLMQVSQAAFEVCSVQEEIISVWMRRSGMQTKHTRQ